MVLYDIVLYGIVLYYMVLYGIVLYCIYVCMYVCNYLVLYLGNIKNDCCSSAGMHSTLFFTMVAAWGRHNKTITRKRARCPIFPIYSLCIYFKLLNCQ